MKIIGNALIATLLIAPVVLTTNYTVNSKINHNQTIVLAKSRHHLHHHKRKKLSSYQRKVRRTLKSLNRTKRAIHHYHAYKLNYRYPKYLYPTKSVRYYHYYVAKVCAYYHLKRYTPLMMAIMQIESNGKGKDLMQSSESAGTLPNTLSKWDSIIQATRNINHIVHRAYHYDDLERHNRAFKKHHNDYATDIPVLAQSYNFNVGYLTNSYRHHVGYRHSLAWRYSKHLARRIGNRHHLNKYHYHGKLFYQNGGNYLYGSLIDRYFYK